MKIDLVPRFLLCWYFFVFASTEVLSFFHLLRREIVLPLEIIFFVLVFIFFRKNIWVQLKKVEFKSRVNLVIFAILLLTFIQGFFSAPSTTDSMVYHLPKVMYWVQERTLYQDVIRNIHDFKAPFAEYIVLHLYFITGNDRLAYLSQWIAFVVSIYITGLFAAQLGANKNVQNYSRVLVATLPMAVLQSASTQVDLVVTTLALITLYISLLLLKKIDFRYGFWLGIAIGLGFLTKATFFFYLITPAVLLFYVMTKYPKKDMAKILIISFLIIIVTQLRFSQQNLKLYGNLLGEHILSDGIVLIYTNDEKSLRAVLSNIVKNVSIQVPVPIFNQPVYFALVGLHNLMGMDINDPNTTCCSTKFKVAGIIYPQEDIVANPIHILLIFTVVVFLFREGFKVKNKLALVIFGFTVLSFVVFSAVLKWQPYHGRLEIPFFIVGSVTAIILLSEVKLGKAITNIGIVFSVILAIAVVLLNVSRPYVSYNLFYDQVKSFSTPTAMVPEAFYLRLREAQNFNAEYFWYEPYKSIVEQLSNYKNINVSFDVMDDFEYPLWALMNSKKIQYKVVPKTLQKNASFIIKTLKTPETIRGFKIIHCEKAKLDIGYACLYNRQS